MAYNPSVPSATQLINASQNDIQTNFAEIEAFVNVNHEGFASPDVGKHKYITFPGQASAPVFVAGEVGMVNRVSTLTAVNELFLTKSSGATFPLTASLPATTGWCYLPSGLLIKWGTLSVNGYDVFNFPTGATIPVFTAVYTAQVTTSFVSTSDVDVFVRLSEVTTTQIKVYGSSRTTTGAATASFNYLVIGV